MTIRELIACLVKHNLDTEVLVTGYEAGYHDLEDKWIYRASICCNVNHGSFYGPHDIDYCNHKQLCDHKIGLVIDRRKRL